MLVLALSLVVAACPAGQFCNTTGPQWPVPLTDGLALAPNDAWVFGENLALHWNGTEWAQTPLPKRARLGDAFAFAPNDVWATALNDVFHWDGAAWSLVERGAGQDGYAGPIVRVRPGETWVLANPVLRIQAGALVPLGSATPEGLAVRSITLGARSCKANDLWVARTDDRQQLMLLHWDGTRTSRLPRTERANVGNTTCVGSTFWLSVDDAVLACSGDACRKVEAPERGQLVEGPTGPWLVAGETLYRWNGKAFEPRAQVKGSWYGGMALGDDELWLSGASGALAHVVGGQPSQPARVSLGRTSRVSLSSEGQPWVVAENGLFNFRDGAWKRIESCPAKTRRGGSVWAERATHLWVVGDGKAWRWFGAEWTDRTPDKRHVNDVWGRSENEVFLSTDDALLAWNGKAFSSLASAPAGWRWDRIAGDRERLAVILRGPRPEEADGPSTGLPDRVLIIEKGAKQTINLPSRPRQLAWVNGQLWATGSSLEGGVSRLVGSRWERLGRDVAGECLVPTARGVLVVGWRSVEWDGTAFKEVELPGSGFCHGASQGEVTWLAVDDAVLRREALSR